MDRIEIVRSEIAHEDECDSATKGSLAVLIIGSALVGVAIYEGVKGNATEAGVTGGLATTFLGATGIGVLTAHSADIRAGIMEGVAAQQSELDLRQRDEVTT